MELYVVVEPNGDTFKPLSEYYCSVDDALKHATAADCQGRRCGVLALEATLVRPEREGEDAPSGA